MTGRAAMLAVWLLASSAAAQSECRAWTREGWILSTGTGILVQQDTGGDVEPLAGPDISLTWFAHPNIGPRISYQFRSAGTWVGSSGTTQQLHLPAIELAVRGQVHRFVSLFAAAGVALAVTYVDHASPTNGYSETQLDAAGVFAVGLDAWTQWVGLRLEVDVLAHRYSTGAGGSAHILVPWA